MKILFIPKIRAVTLPKLGGVGPRGQNFASTDIEKEQVSTSPTPLFR